MKVSGVVAMLCIAGATLAQPTVVGVWRAALVTPPTGKDAASLKELVAKSSLKLNKDKTFGIQLMRTVMIGTWSMVGNQLTLSVHEVLGKSVKEVARMPAQNRTAHLVMKGGKLYLTPPSGKNPLVWKKRS